MAQIIKRSTSNTASAAPARDAETEQIIRGTALKRVVINLSPVQVLIIPLVLACMATMRAELDSSRAIIWIAAAVLTAVLVAASVWLPLFRPGLSTAEPWPLLTGIALAVLAATTGFSTWTSIPGAGEMAVITALFPAVGCTVGAVSTAGRLDMYLSYLLPAVTVGASGIWLSGSAHGHTLAVLLVVFASATVMLHIVVSRSLLSELRLQAAATRLAGELATDQAALSDAYGQLRATNERLEHLASHDPLTGLFNRRGALEAFEHWLAEPSGRPVALLFCDLDRFKAVNDLLGHRGGDQFLIALADRITRTVGPHAIAGRIGGDEFVIVLPDHDAALATAVASRLVHVLAQPVQAEGRVVPSSVSIGVAAFPEHGSSSSNLLRNANTALYRAKRGGRNRVEMFDGEMQEELQSAMNAEQSLRRAIDDGAILPYFQPEIDATTGQVVGAELLARWAHDDGTVADAMEFIDVARRAGLLERLTERVLSQARPDIRRLASLGLPSGFRFRINLAPASTDRAWRYHRIEDLLRGIDPSLVIVDVRESALLNDLPSAAATLASFRANGGRVCLEDFARGVSSLTMLRKLPVDEVRIDRASIDSITAHPHDRAVVRAVISLVREVGLSVTADGVENGAQADALIALGCVRQQGYLYAPALSTEEFESFLLNRQARELIDHQSPAQDWSVDQLG